MPEITARDTATGKTVTFNWNGDGNPSDADMADVFKAAGTHAGEAPPMGPRGTLPGMHTDAPRTSADDPAALELNQSLEGPAKPQGLGDMASLLIPSAALGTGYRALRGYASAAKNLVMGAAEGAGNREGLKKIPSVLRGMLQTATDPASGGERAFQRAPLTQQMEALPATPAPVTTRGSAPPMSRVNPNDVPLASQVDRLPATPAPMRTRMSDPPIRNLGTETTPVTAPAPTAQPAASGAISDADRALMAKRYPGLDPAKVEQQMSGQLRMVPSHESPLQQPRVNVGAEQVGRGQGLTKEQVRSQTAPILGEAQGEASPIFPQQTLGKIVDAVKALPSSEREAYVAKATSGKAQWQIENIRRTLEHLGLLVGATTGAGAIREQVKQRLAQ